MNANELADAMETRASIRRKATSRKSVQENANDRLADQLEQAATMLRQQQAEIEALKKQIPDWKNINKPNPFIGWEKNLVAVDSNPNSGLGGVALRKAQEK